MKNNIDNTIIDFLKKLAKNNNREWFNENKKVYEKARGAFILFVAHLIEKISSFDASIDKTPYKTNFGAHIVANHAKPHDRAGYYLHIEPGNSFLASGAYLPPGPWIKAIRNKPLWTESTIVFSTTESRYLFNDEI